MVEAHEAFPLLEGRSSKRHVELHNALSAIFVACQEDAVERCMGTNHASCAINSLPNTAGIQSWIGRLVFENCQRYAVAEYRVFTEQTPDKIRRWFQLNVCGCVVGHRA